MYSSYSLPPVSTLVATANTSSSSPPPPLPSNMQPRLLSPPSSPSRHPHRLYHKKQFSLQTQVSAATSQTIKFAHGTPISTSVLPSPPAEGNAQRRQRQTSQRQASVIEEEEALLVLNIAKQRSPTPPPTTTLAISPSASPQFDSSIRPELTQPRSAFTLFSPLRSSSSSSALQTSYEELPPEKLQGSPERPENPEQARNSLLPSRKRKSSLGTEKEETKRGHQRNSQQEEGDREENGNDYEEELRGQRRHSSTNGKRGTKRKNDSLGTTGRRRRKEEEEDEDFQVQEEEEDSDPEDCLEVDEDSDEEFLLPATSGVLHSSSTSSPSTSSSPSSKKQARKRSKVSSLLPTYEKPDLTLSTSSFSSSTDGSSSPSGSPNKRDKGLSYLHDLGPELRNYLAAWLTRHTSVEGSSSDPLFHCIKCIPPAGEQSRVSSSDRHKPGRVRIAIPQQLRKSYLPEKILAYHASSALFGRLPAADQLANLVASHRCGHSWCVAAHHLVWEPLGSKLARERGKQSCVGGDSCRHGPLKCFKMTSP